MTSVAPEGLPPISGTAAKNEFRARLRAARASRTCDPAADGARTARALAACAGVPVVAAYASRPDEPDTRALLEALRGAGVAVLLPVLRAEPGWAAYTGDADLRPGRFGIPEPPGPLLGGDALGSAGWVWLPGLAGTPDGRRLGTGGGWYDRALAHAAPTARLGLLLFDDEVLPDLPTDPWDRRVHLLVTERRRVDAE